MYFIYQFKDKNDKTIYVGKTTNLKQRFDSHFSEEGWKQTEVKDITYAKCLSEVDMSIYEVYYINKLKPKYNISLVCKDKPTIILPELEFSKYDNVETIINCYKNKGLFEYDDSKYDLSIMEQRIISFGLSKINTEEIKISDSKQEELTFMTRILAKDFINNFKINNNSIYKELEVLMKGLNNKKTIINNKIYNYVKHSYYDYEKNSILLFFNIDVLNYLLKNKEKFNMIHKTLGEIKNKYSYLFYEIINEGEISVEELRYRLNLNNKYPEYSNFKQRIIIPCIKELTKVLDFNINLEEIYENKKVVMVKFKK